MSAPSDAKMTIERALAIAQTAASLRGSPWGDSQGCAIVLLAESYRTLQADNAELRRLLAKCRDEMSELPHSLGYAFTHLPELDAALTTPRSDSDTHPANPHS